MTRRALRKCVCGGRLTQPTTGRPRRYCSDACRQRAYRARRARPVLLSRSSEWYTPARFIAAARLVLGDIELDPATCATANETVRATRTYTAADDGLAQPWAGTVWLNPPYGRQAGSFVAKLLHHHDNSDVPAAIALLNSNSMEARWFQPLYEHPLCLVAGRIDFETPDGKASTATHGSVFVYLGPDRQRFAEVFGPFGSILGRLHGTADRAAS